MSQLTKTLIELDNNAKVNGIDMDIFIKTRNEGGLSEGDGFAYLFLNEEGLYDVSFLQNRIPKNAWMSEKGIKEAYKINQDGKQYYSYEKSLHDAIKAVADFWHTSMKNVELLSCETNDLNIVQLVIELK